MPGLYDGRDVFITAKSDAEMGGDNSGIPCAIRAASVVHLKANVTQHTNVYGERICQLWGFVRATDRPEHHDGWFLIDYGPTSDIFGLDPDVGDRITSTVIVNWWNQKLRTDTDLQDADAKDLAL